MSLPQVPLDPAQVVSIKTEVYGWYECVIVETKDGETHKFLSAEHDIGAFVNAVNQAITNSLDSYIGVIKRTPIEPLA
jgi:hypothetical protein